MKKFAVFCGVLALSLGLVACNSDREIVAKAGEAIEKEQLAGTVRVTSDDGVVTLTGTVPDASVKERAGEIVADIGGVEQVINTLRTSAGDAPLDMHDPPALHDNGAEADTYYPPPAD